MIKGIRLRVRYENDTLMEMDSLTLNLFATLVQDHDGWTDLVTVLNWRGKPGIVCMTGIIKNALRVEIQACEIDESRLEDEREESEGAE